MPNDKDIVWDTPSTKTGDITWDNAPKPGGLSAKGNAYRPKFAQNVDNPSIVEEAIGGLKHSWDKSALGLEKSVKGLANYIPGVKLEVDPENQENYERGKEFVKGTSAASSIGEFAGDTAQGMATGGSGLLAKTAANMGWSALTAPEDKLEAAAWAGGGTVGGHVLGQAVKGGQRLFNKAKAWSGIGDDTGRALKVIEGKVGADEVARAAQQLENPTPSMLPRTTAAAAQSPQLGSIERGARTRNLAGKFQEHDKAVDKAAWEQLKTATKGAEGLPYAEKLPGSIMSEAQEQMNKIPLSKDNRGVVGQQLAALRGSQAVVGDTTGMAGKQIDSVIRVLDNPDAKLGSLAHARTNIASQERFPGQTEIKNILDDMIDARGKGIQGETLESYAHAQEALKAAQASQRLRGTFDVEGVPRTTNYQGDSGVLSHAGGEVPSVPTMSSAPLRRSLISELEKDSGDVKYMNPDEVKHINQISDQLRTRDIYKPAEAPGSANLGMGPVEGVASTVLNAGPAWRMRGAMGSFFKGFNERTMAKVDEAMLDPQKFIEMVDAKAAKGVALQEWEQKAAQFIKSSAHVGGGVGSAIGKE